MIGPDGKPYISDQPGTLGGHSKLKIYGRLDCPSAKRYAEDGVIIRVEDGNAVKEIRFFRY